MKGLQYFHFTCVPQILHLCQNFVSFPLCAFKFFSLFTVTKNCSVSSQSIIAFFEFSIHASYQYDEGNPSFCL